MKMFRAGKWMEEESQLAFLQNLVYPVRKINTGSLVMESNETEIKSTLLVTSILST